MIDDVPAIRFCLTPPTSVLPRISKHRVIEPFPICPVVVLKTPSAEEEDLVILEPEFTQRRGSYEDVFSGDGSVL